MAVDSVVGRGGDGAVAPITVRIPQAAKMLGIGRTTVYALIKAREIETVKVGSATLVVVDSLSAFISRLRQADDCSCQSVEN